VDANQIRTQLLTQHAELRALIEEVRAAKGRARGGEPRGGDVLIALVDRLASALQAHNLCEERLLKGILVTVDAWGPARVEIMDERHSAEHKEIHAELLEASFEPERIDHLLDQLILHMAHEERAFLNDEVLREDSILIDAFGG
jgi:hypothetical protein